jgi:hypothetical protein
MKKLLTWFLSLFKKKVPTPTPSKTPQPPKPTPSAAPNEVTNAFNVNGLEEDINKVCNTGVLTIYTKCTKLDFGCYVFTDFECTEFQSLIGKHFHDYTNDVVYQVQEDGMIVNLGRCRN